MQIPARSLPLKEEPGLDLLEGLVVLDLTRQWQVRTRGNC